MPPLALLSAGGGIDVCGCVASADGAAVAARVSAAMGGEVEAPVVEAPPVPPPPCVATGALRVCCLGTGCSVPSPYRAPAAIYLEHGEVGGVMLDAGEGCTGQLVRLLGAEGAAAALRRLTVVWISHAHADHHLGLPRLVLAAASVRGPDAPPLLVVAPRVVCRWAESCIRSLPPSRLPSCRIVSCDRFGDAQSAERHWLLRESGLGLTELRSVPVHHCADAWGCVLTHRSGWKVVYSGDTRPCDALVAAGAGATLLIHEATIHLSLIHI